MDVEIKRRGIDLEKLKHDGRVIAENAAAYVIDIGDRIGMVEFRSKVSPMPDEVCEILIAAVSDYTDYFDAMVIGSRGRQFCAGANLQTVFELVSAGALSKLEQMVQTFQQVAMLLRYGPTPVVAAPFEHSLGGGCELCLHSARVVLAATTRMGLIETGAGLIPAGGGTKELGVRALNRVTSNDKLQMMHALERTFDMIMAARISSNGKEAKDLFLHDDDFVVPTQECAIDVAKSMALTMLDAGYSNRGARSDIPVLGRAGIDIFQEKIGKMRVANQISDHDEMIGLHLATVLCGGDHAFGYADEQHFLDLERHAFLELAGTLKTQQRIECLLKRSKVLRN